MAGAPGERAAVDDDILRSRSICDGGGAVCLIEAQQAGIDGDGTVVGVGRGIAHVATEDQRGAVAVVGDHVEAAARERAADDGGRIGAAANGIQRRCASECRAAHVGDVDVAERAVRQGGTVVDGQGTEPDQRTITRVVVVRLAVVVGGDGGVAVDGDVVAPVQNDGVGVGVGDGLVDFQVATI